MTSVATTTEKREHPVVTLMKSNEAREAIAVMLPEGQTYERVVREFFLAAADNPKILECEPASIVRAISRAVSWDLVIGVTAFLVPRKTKRTDAAPKLHAQQGYRGKIELIVRHRAARLVDAQCVYSNETFRYQQGTSPFIEHHPIMDPKKRGELIGAYAYAKLSAYEVKIIVMSADEVDAIRQQYSQQWNTKWENGNQVKIELREIPWYLLARCVHRLAKQIPMSPKVAKLLTDDDDEPEEIPPEIARVETDVQTLPATRSIEERAPLDPSEIVGECEPGDEGYEPTPFD